MSQVTEIRKYMLAGHSITPREALDKFGCFRLARVINDIRRDYDDDVRDEFIKTPRGKRVKKYWIDITPQISLFK